MEDLIADEDVVVTMSHAGYIKSQPLTAYRAQRRGGRGKTATSMKEEDFVDKLLIASTHDTILCFYQPRQGVLEEGVRNSRRPGAARAASRS